MRSFVTKLKSA
jgi:hypothetical protein